MPEANPFDQFDAPVAVAANPFDQFDSPSQQAASTAPQTAPWWERFAGGLQHGLEGSGVGFLQTAHDLGNTLYGANPHDATEEAAMNRAAANVAQQEKGSGIIGTAGEIAGNPTNWAPWKSMLAMGFTSGLTAPSSNDTGLLRRAEMGAIEAPIAAATGKIANTVLGKPIQAIFGGEQPTVGTINDLAKNAYESGEQMGGSIPIQNMQDAVNDMIGAKEFTAPSERAEQFAGQDVADETLGKLKQAVGLGESPEANSAPWTIQEANKVDDKLRSDIQKAYSSGDNALGRRLSIIKNGLKNVYTQFAEQNPDQAAGFAKWIEGDKLYSAAMTAQTIQDGLENAAKADVPATATRNFFKNFVKNDDLMAPLTEEERNAAERAAKYGIVTASLKNIGSRMGAHIAGSIAGGAAGMAGGPLMAAGGALAGDVGGLAVTAPFRAAATARQMARGQNVIDQIIQRPVVQQALEQAGKLPAETALAKLPAHLAPRLSTTLINEQNPPPATSSIGDQNMQELQKLKSQMAPTASISPQPSDFFAKEAKAESGNNPNAKNPNSSASGPFQFTDGTWKQMVKRYGAETGIKEGDKNDPQSQATMARLYARDNINRMEPFLKRNPTKGELYMAHVFGPDGALRLIQAANSQPHKQAMMLFPKAVTSANRSLFFDGAQPRTALDVYQRLSQKVL